MGPDKEEIKSVLARTVIMLCEHKLTCKYWFSVKGSLEINIDDEENFLVEICEKVLTSGPQNLLMGKKTSGNMSNTAMSAVLQSTASEFLSRMIKQEVEGEDGICEEDNSPHDLPPGVLIQEEQTKSAKTCKLGPFLPRLWYAQTRRDILPDARDTGQGCANEGTSTDDVTSVRQTNSKPYSVTINEEDGKACGKFMLHVKKGKGDLLSTKNILGKVPEKERDSFDVDKLQSSSYESDSDEDNNNQDDSITINVTNLKRVNGSDSDGADASHKIPRNAPQNNKCRRRKQVSYKTREDNTGTGEETELNVCLTCGKKFVHQKRYENHVLNIHPESEKSNTKYPSGEMKFTCPICDDEFSDKSSLKVHLLTHSEDKNFGCSVCKKKFRCRAELIIHKRIHTGERPFMCDICSKTFRRTGNLKAHMVVHTQQRKSHACNICGKAFSHLITYKKHIASHSGDKCGVVCNICGKVLAHQSTLKIHQRKHSGERKHACNVCGQSFAQMGNLKVHQRIHTGEKPYVCKLCNLRFAQLSSLNYHMPSHTGQKDLICNTCGKGFINSYRLKIHERIHTGEKPHLCAFCGKSFAEHGNLKAHIRIHTGEKPYTCTYCGKAFSQHSSMKVHERMHTGEKPYMCDICGTGFSQMASLKSHRLAHSSDSI